MIYFMLARDYCESSFLPMRYFKVYIMSPLLVPFSSREIITNGLRVIVNNLFKKYNYQKKNILTSFFIFHKNNIETFLK